MPGNSKPDQRTFPSAARAVAAAGVLAASVYAVNLSAGAAVPGQLAESVARAGTAPAAAPPSGILGSRNYLAAQGEPEPSSADQVGAGALPPAILSNPHVALAYPHTSVGGAPATAGALAVGPAGAGRPSAGFLMAPLQFLDPSSPFGFRVSPLSGAAGDFHLGQDYAAACGTPVYAADSGVVRAAGWHPWGGGNRVEIDHGDGLITTYNHLESIGVRTGDKVQVGQVVARVGTTGWSTGCHLHFEAILNGRYTNPLRWSFLQLRALNQALPAHMVSYAPGGGVAGGRISWTIPLHVDTGVEFPAAGLQESPFPPLLPPAPAPTGVVLPPPDVQLTTTAPPTAEPSGSAGPPSPDPAPSDPSPSPTLTAPAPSPTPTPTEPTPTPPGSTPTPAEPSPTPTAPVPSPSPTPTAPAPSPSPSESAPPPSEPVPGGPVSSAPAPAPAPAPTPTTVAPVPAPAPAPTETVPAAAPTTADPAPAPTLPPAEPTPSPVPTATLSDPAPPAPAA